MSHSSDISQFPNNGYNYGVLRPNTRPRGSRLKTYLAVVLVFIMVSTSFAIIDFSNGQGSSSQSSIAPYSQTSGPSFYLNQSD